MAKDTPLGLPTGSIRAILALVSTGTWVFFILYEILVGDGGAAKELLMDPPALVALICGFYFGARAKKGPGDTP